MNGPITFLVVIVLALAAYPLARLAADGRLRRLFPRLHRALVALLVSWIGVVAACAVLAPPVVLHLAAATAAIALGAFAFRARPRYGARRRLPPGSLSVTKSVRAIADRRHYLKEARRHGPIFKSAQFHRPMVCIVGLERGHRLLRESARALEVPPLPYSRDVTSGFLRYMDDETHARYGPVLRRALARPVVLEAEGVVAETARHELGNMAAACRESGTGGVRPGPYTDRIVQGSLVFAMFGIAPATDAARQFERLYAPIAAHDLGRPLSDEARRALPSIRALLGEHVAAGRAGGGAPVSSLTELGRLDSSLPDATCLDNLVIALRTGGGNAASLLRWLMEMLGRHSDWAARARGGLIEANEGGSRDLVDRIVMETLRLAQREYAYRVLTDDVDFEGFRLPKGWFVRVCVWESHRSPDAFADPEAFDPDRFLSPTFDRARYSPFGQGQHACSGISLAESICRTTIAELLAGFELEVVEDGPPERDFRHWDHWRPSSKLSLRLTPVDVETRVAEGQRR